MQPTARSLRQRVVSHSPRFDWILTALNVYSLLHYSIATAFSVVDALDLAHAERVHATALGVTDVASLRQPLWTTTGVDAYAANDHRLIIDDILNPGECESLVGQCTVQSACYMCVCMCLVLSVWCWSVLRVQFSLPLCAFAHCAL